MERILRNFLFKKGSRTRVSSYQLPFFLKRFVFDKLYLFVETSLSQNQYALLKRKTTILQLLDFVKDTQSCKDSRKVLHTI